MIETKSVLTSTQEQAVASWINYINQLRIDRLMEELSNEHANLEVAVNTVNETFTKIGREIVHNGLGRGGAKGMHGFIAEVAEVGVGNAREQIEGHAPIYQWINDNGPADLLRGVEQIQQKFVNSDNHLSLYAIKMHFNKYPNFLKEGGKYQIPADHFRKIKWLLSIPKKEAYKMSTSIGDFSLKQWKEVHEFFQSNDIPMEKIEPSSLDYANVQKNTYEKTLMLEKKKLKERNKERCRLVYKNSKPSIKEGVNATVFSAVVEGGVSLSIQIAQKLQSGKKIQNFNQEDWKDIFSSCGLDTLKGTIRSSSIYVLTNYTATPAAVANAIMSASFSVAEQAYQLRQGNLDETAFIENSEIVCLDATISALSSYAGQIILPIPVLGALIGNAVGTLFYQIVKDNLSNKELELVNQYMEDIRRKDNSLQEKYKSYIFKLSEDMKQFMQLLNIAFAPDIRIAFDGSVSLAKEMGVPTEEILDNQEKIFNYFMD